MVHGYPANADRGRSAQGRRPVATDVERRTRALYRLWLEGQGSEVEEGAVVFHDLLAPQASAHFDGFVDTGAASVEVEPEGDPLGTQPAGADAERQAALGQDVDGGGCTSREERMAQADVVDVDA